MKKFKFKDETSYSRGDRENIPPRVLATTVNGIRIVIHRHKDYPETWLLSVGRLNIDKEDLNTDDFEIAEERAKEMILKEIDELNKIKDYILEIN